MKKQDVQKKERKSVPISIRTYPKYSKWMKDNNVSPNAVFNEAMKELVDKE
ncbi:hypothetical protein LCGC14_2797780 [marine sediment metagenome]|uniref:Uncharacterized protein n=1 Tax=marine sediment metagenome TaxID=412755 RepID=A0A0F8YNL2_9ZZZZ